MAAEPTYAFLVTLADEGTPQLEACLGFLRAAYPHAPAVVISDGVVDPGYEAACRRHRAEYHQGAFLKRIECGGAWWKRFLELGLATGADYLVKLDPDARIWRPFRGVPPAPISGTLENAGTDRENIQGGVQAIAAGAARRILAAGRTGDAALRSEFTFTADDDERRRRWRALAYLSTDSTLMWLARDAGVPVADWAEVASVWLPPAPPNPDGLYAATHPHKVELAPRFLDAPLHVVTTCRGRLHHLRETLPAWLAEPGVTATVVDYNCPDGTADWVRANHPEARVVRVHDAPSFSLAAARNRGAAAARGADWLCFWDADWECKPGWAKAVRGSLRAGRYLLANPIEWGQFGSVVVRAADFRAAGGYDELIRGWAPEDGDFYSRLRHVGVHPGSFPGSFFRSIPHDDAARVAHYEAKDKRRNQRIYDAYHSRKVRHMLATGRLPRPEECRMILTDAYLESGVELPDAFYGGDTPRFPVTVYPPGVEAYDGPPRADEAAGSGIAPPTAVDATPEYAGAHALAGAAAIAAPPVVITMTNQLTIRLGIDRDGSIKAHVVDGGADGQGQAVAVRVASPNP